MVCRQDLNQLGKQLTKLSRHISKVDIRHIRHLQDRITLLEQGASHILFYRPIGDICLTLRGTFFLSFVRSFVRSRSIL